MIELHRVWKVFAVGPVKVPALSDVSFRVAKGEFVTLHGASGAGKTTLLRLLYREELPTEGEIEVLDYDVPALRVREVAELRRSIGVVFQDAKLLPGRTVYENVAFVLRVLGTPRREITPRVFDALRAVGLSSRAQAYPAQLSQGEAQRAALPPPSCRSRSRSRRSAASGSCRRPSVRPPRTGATACASSCTSSASRRPTTLTRSWSGCWPCRASAPCAT